VLTSDDWSGVLSGRFRTPPAGWGLTTRRPGGQVQCRVLGTGYTP